MAGCPTCGALAKSRYQDEYGPWYVCEAGHSYRPQILAQGIPSQNDQGPSVSSYPPSPSSYFATQPDLHPQPYLTPDTEAKGARAAMILGIVGLIGVLFCGLPGLTGIAAIILGRQAKKLIKQSGGRLSGDEKATAGIVMGSIATALAVAVMAFVGAISSTDVSTTGTGTQAPPTERPIPGLDASRLRYLWEDSGYKCRDISTYGGYECTSNIVNGSAELNVKTDGATNRVLRVRLSITLRDEDNTKPVTAVFGALAEDVLASAGDSAQRFAVSWAEANVGRSNSTDISGVHLSTSKEGDEYILVITASTVPTFQPSPLPSSAGSSAQSQPQGTHPAGTTGRCRDGTYTDAKTPQGACSHHGGLEECWG